MWRILQGNIANAVRVNPFLSDKGCRVVPRHMHLMPCELKWMTVHSVCLPRTQCNYYCYDVCNIVCVLLSVCLMWLMTGFPHLESPGFFFSKFSALGVSLVLESPGIHLLFELTNMRFMCRTPCVNKCTKYSFYVQLVMNVLRWIVLSHCIYRLNNCHLSVRGSFDK